MDELLEEMKELKRLILNSNKGAFSARGASEYLSIGYDTILRETRIGSIEHMRNGTSYIYKKEWLDRWLDKNKRGAV